MTTTIKQWETSQDGISKLKQTTAALPVPGPNEVLVKISAISINYRDTEVIKGLYDHHKTTGGPVPTLVPCSDMCGTISASNSAMWKEGDRVLSIFNQTHLKGQIKPMHMKSGLGLPLPGVLAEYRVFSEDGLVKAPAYLSDEEASTLPIAGVTAWMAMNGMRPLGRPGGKGETVLIQGTGGVAINGLQIAHAAGAEVIITSSSDIKLEQAKKLGADKTINYRTTPNWDEEVLSLTGDIGADIIFENGGASTLRKSFECVAFGGLINCIGIADFHIKTLTFKRDPRSHGMSREVSFYCFTLRETMSAASWTAAGYLGGKVDKEEDRTNTNLLALKRNVTLKGLLNGPRARFEEMLRFFEEHQIRPAVDRVFKFEEAREALEYLFAGGHFGKVVIKVG